MKLKHVVITAVARDDMADGGAEHFARTIEAVRAASPGIVVEVLVPDFHNREEAVRKVIDAAPDVFNHNLETCERLTPVVRSRAKYRVSLALLRRVKELSPHMATKSGIMLGLGETEPEIFQTMDDLREGGRGSAHDGPILATHTTAPTGGCVHPSRPVQDLRGDRLRQRLRACLLRAAGAQFLSCRGLRSRKAVTK